ncbi:MAG: hypothetical protein JWO06_3876 [Bacteroidota bacterium]|nr:hypothetical protein [Bacteroidota bacterium]
MKAKCTNPKCGLEFDSQVIQAEGIARNITIVNSRTDCPKCGHIAKLQDGVFDFEGSFATLIKSFSSAEMEEFKLLATKFDADGGSEADFFEGVRKINPLIETALKKLIQNIKDVPFKEWLKILILSLGIIYGDKVSIKDVNINIGTTTNNNVISASSTTLKERMERASRKNNLKKIKTHHQKKHKHHKYKDNGCEVKPKNDDAK